VPVVTAIKRQARVGSTRFNVSLDGSYTFTISDLDLSMSGLRVGQELTPEEAEQLSQNANEAKAYALALRYLGVRVRSRRELTDYLTRKGCESQESEAALERLEGLGLVDDLRFAQAWIADRMAVRPRSRMRLSQELAAKGVSRDIVDIALQELEPEREVSTLKDLIIRKQRSGGYSDPKKLIGYLQRQGYRWDLIKEALQEIEDAN
jgi:regulatory protein